MNRIDFSYTGGFPLETDTLDFLQKSMSGPINALTGLGGDNYIISGITDAGQHTTDGWVVINGEILPFKGDLKQSSVIIVEAIKTADFEDGRERGVYLSRYATFGTGLKSIPFASLTRISDLQKQKKKTDELQAAHDEHKAQVTKRTGELQTAHDSFKTQVSQEMKTNVDALKARLNMLEQKAAPFTMGGVLLLWQKPAHMIPAGWREATDWRGRMPMGWNPGDEDFNTLGKTGGNKQVSIKKTHLPAVSLSTGVFYNSQDYVDGGAAPNNIGTHGGHPVKTENLGDGTALNIMNPYRIVLFIEYVG